MIHHRGKIVGPCSITHGGLHGLLLYSFIARISYGRSIKEFVIGVLFVPSLIVFLWMGIFGNAAIHQVINETSQLEQVVNTNFDVALFSLFEAYPVTKFISIVSLILIVTFFVTSSDSGALVASMLSSKKQTSINDDSPIFQELHGRFC